MNGRAIGLQLVRARRSAGLTQAEVAARMRTTQSAVSRVESGRTLPSLAFIERYARAAGRPITFTIGGDPIEPSRKELRRRVRAAIGDFTFDPWRRDPSPAEARTLVADGLTREHFQSAATP